MENKGLGGIWDRESNIMCRHSKKILEKKEEVGTGREYMTMSLVKIPSGLFSTYHRVHIMVYWKDFNLHFNTFLLYTVHFLRYKMQFVRTL